MKVLLGKGIDLCVYNDRIPLRTDAEIPQRYNI